MARQTAQAKLLREARDELASRAPELEKVGFLALGLNAARAKEIQGGEQFNSADLAEILGVSLDTLRNWMVPADNQRHREMPKTAHLLLARILAEARGKRGKAKA